MRNTDMKQHIIKVTRNLLKESHDITIKNIADASYVNIASVNYYFGSKDQLFKIVCSDFINDLKNGLLDIMLHHDEEDTESLLRKTTSFLFECIMENAGIMNYILQNLGNEQGDVLLQTFFTENRFTLMLFDVFTKQTNITNRERLISRYTILFAAFLLPLFIKLSKAQSTKNNFINDDLFSEMFLEELQFIIKHDPNTV